MKNKLLITLLAIVCVLCCAFFLVACDNGSEGHAHNYKWVNNGDGTHKQRCQNDGCDALDINVGNHDFANGNCICGAEKPDNHTHDFTRKNAAEQYLYSAATCTAKGVYYYSCECGEQGTAKFEFGEMSPHAGGTATCTQKAICTACGQEYGELLAHSYTQEVAKSQYQVSEATCTAKAVYYYSCECGEQGTATFESGEFGEHSYGNWADEVAATCSAIGTKAHKDCGLCQKHFDNEDNEIFDLTLAKDANAHKYGEWQTVLFASCEEKGEKKRECSLCHTEDTQEIAAINHDWDEPTYEWAADYSSCTALRICKNDSSHTESETATAELRTLVQATDSAFGECNYVVNFQNAAFSAATSPTFDVSTDGVAYQPQESYEWTNDGSTFGCTVTKVCVSDSAKTITETAAVTFEEITPASCTSEGVGRYVARFQNLAFATQYSENVVIPQRIHVVSMSEWGKDANGHWRNCEYGCGEQLSYAEHTSGEWEVTIDPTFAYEGEQVKKCSVCDFLLETEVIPKLTNDWNGTAIAGSFEGGSGSINSPYLIKTGAQLKYLASLINSGTKGYSSFSYKLVDNINLGGYEWDPIGCLYVTSASDYSLDYAFSGTFDGNGYVVSNFKVTSAQKDFYQYFGLFGRIHGGTVKNLGVENFNIDITATDANKSDCFTGGFAGMIISSSTITNCYTANGTVTATSSSGSICAGGFTGGACSSIISYCFSSATVTGNGIYAKVGGLIGDFYCSSSLESDLGKLTYSFATGNVTAVGKSSSYAGSVMGRKQFATSSNCYRYEAQEIMKNNKAYTPTDATKCTLNQLNDKTFYTGTLKWSEFIWDFSALDIENGQLPKLKPGITA